MNFKKSCIISYKIPQFINFYRTLTICKLESRSLIHLQGQDSIKFLQGLISNDMNIFDSSKNNLSHLNLNNEGIVQMIYSGIFDARGRVQCDLFVHKQCQTDNSFLLDCCTKYQDNLLNLLKKYRLRSKITIENVSKNYGVYSLFNVDDNWGHCSDPQKRELQELIKGTTDYRNKELGYRFIIQDGNNDLFQDNIELKDESEFRSLRYKMGIAENSNEIPPNVALPLEYNFDINHGVSFEKGCFLGQELCARTKYTGVIRKRIVPIKINTELIGDESWIGSKIVVESPQQRVVGQLRGFLGNLGIALVRLECYGESYASSNFHLEQNRDIRIELMKTNFLNK